MKVYNPILVEIVTSLGRLKEAIMKIIEDNGQWTIDPGLTVFCLQHYV
jgi:hypothetical protein